MPTAEAASRTRRASAPSPDAVAGERRRDRWLWARWTTDGRALEQRLEVDRRQVHRVGLHALDGAARGPPVERDHPPDGRIGGRQLRDPPAQRQTPRP